MLFKPAVIEKDVDYLAEPGVYNVKNGESISALRKKLSGNEVEEFGNKIREEYIQYLNEKVKGIVLRIVSSCNVDIILFPEYSIPYQCLPGLAELAKAYNVFIVAGTHMVMQSAYPYYELAGLNAEELVKQHGMAVAPILNPNGRNNYQRKMTQSIFETTLLTSKESKVEIFELNTKEGNNSIFFSVLICIDALRTKLIGKMMEEMASNEKGSLLLVPAYSPSTDCFYDNAKTISKENVTLVCSNTSLYGESGIYITPNVQFRFRNAQDEKPKIPKNEEAVIELEFDVDGMYTKKGVIDDRIIGRYNIYSICYGAEQKWIENYNELWKQLQKMVGESEILQIDEAIDEFLLNNFEIPVCVKKSLEIFRKKLSNYSGNKEEIMREIIVLPISTYDTKVIFGNEIQKAIMFCGSMGTVAKEQMMTLLGEADKYKAKSIKPIQVSLPINLTKESIPDSVVNSFRGRGNYINKFQEFMGCEECKCIIVNGTYGIGKTCFVDVTLQRHYPDWKIERITLPPTIRFSMLLEYLGSMVGMHISADTIARSGKDVMRPILQKLAEAIFGVARRCIIVDDMVSVLANADGRDLNIIDYFFKAVDDISNKKGKLILIGSVWFPEQITCRNICKQITIKDLEKKYIERIIIYEMRVKEMVETEKAPEIPEKIFQIIKGHPLSAKLVVEILKHNTKASFDEIDSKLCRSELLSRLTSMIAFDVKEKKILMLISVFRTIINVQDLSEILNDELNKRLKEEMKILVKSPYINFDGQALEIVEVFREHFYEELRNQEYFTEFHEYALNYYQKLHNQMQESGQFSPIIYAEMTYHCLVLGKLDELKDMLDGNRETLKMHAKIMYQKYKEYNSAFEVYKILDEVFADDTEVLSYLGRCSARLIHWEESKKYFKRAIQCASERKEQTWYLYRDWAHILIRYGRIEEGQEKLAESQICLKKETEKSEDAAILAAEGYILDSRGEIENAINKYEKALEYVWNHRFAIHYYSKLLKKLGENDKARVLQERLEPVDDMEPANQIEQYDFLSRTDEIDDD